MLSASFCSGSGVQILARECQLFCSFSFHFLSSPFVSFIASAGDEKQITKYQISAGLICCYLPFQKRRGQGIPSLFKFLADIWCLVIWFLVNG